jgi:hypothetical protein
MESIYDSSLDPRMHLLLLNRKEIYAQQYFRLMPGIQNNLQIFEEVDRAMHMAFITLHSSVVAGESVAETKSVEYSYQFSVFATWLDHLKYDIKEGRVMGWIPQSLRGRLTVRYQIVTKKRHEDVPVTVHRYCPHADIHFGNRPYVHMQWMEPLKMADWKL